jgi:hypothetical protein
LNFSAIDEKNLGRNDSSKWEIRFLIKLNQLGDIYIVND